MKKITIDGVEYYYFIHGETSHTYFYTKKEYEAKKYCFFGKKITKTKNVYQFMICLDIESPYNSKSNIQTAINRELEVLKRKEEIQRGEII